MRATCANLSFATDRGAERACAGGRVRRATGRLRAALAMSAICMFLTAGGCGVKGPPRPPRPAAAAPADGGTHE